MSSVSGTSSSVSTTAYPSTLALIDVKTASELVYITNASSPVSGGNRLLINNLVLTPIVPINFPAIVLLKAPCEYLFDVKISIMSDNGNYLAFFATYRMAQLTPGGALVYSAPVLAFLNDSSTATGSNLVVFAKNPTLDAIDMQINPTNGGNMTCSVWLEIFNDRDF